MMKYAILGAGGQVSQEFLKYSDKISMQFFSHNQLDITDPDSVKDLFHDIDSNVIINLAAFHNVNKCEQDIKKSFMVNSVGIANVALAAKEKKCKVVHFSTDYVFGSDTQRSKPYLESDTTGPLNVYGISKASGEQLLRNLHDNHLIIRTSSLFGVNTSKKGWTFPEMIIKKAKAGEPLRVVNDQYMSPTYTRDLVDTVITLIEANAKGIVHVTNGGGCSWYEFAVKTLQLAGINYSIEAVSSDAFPSPAKRPAYSRLDSERLARWNIQQLRNWAEALESYLCEKGEIKIIQ